MSFQSRTHRGFTLVELLLAVTLMSLLLALAYGGMRAATRATESGQELLAQTGKLRITHQFVRRQVNQMLPLGFLMDDSDEPFGVMFAGGGDFIQFVAPMPGYLGSGGPQVQRMEIVDGEKGLTLQFSHALLQDYLPEYLYERNPVILMEGFADARFEFLGLGEEGEYYEWLGTWDYPDVLPRAVRLEVDMGDDSKVSWPQMTAAVKIDPMAVELDGSNEDYQQVIQDLIQGKERN